MPINILMPALSPTMEKGNLANWLKKEGDKVKSGDVIAEIETDKATMEVEAVDDGVFAKIVVPEGTQDVPVNDLIAVLAGDGEDVKAAAAAWAKSAPPRQGRSTSYETRAEPAPAHAAAPRQRRRRRRGFRAIGAASQWPRPPVFLAAGAQSGQRSRHRPRPDPRLRPAWPHHRARCRRREIRQGPESPGRAPAGVPRSRASMSDQQILALFEHGSYEVIPHDGMRRTIAQRLQRLDADRSALLPDHRLQHRQAAAAREEINAAAPKDKEGKPPYRLSVNDFVIKAMAVALQRVPNANVSWTEGGMLKHKHSDIGVAVAMPGGLITPIIRQAEMKSLSAISGECKDLRRARAHEEAQAEEYQGGTSSVSNLGMYGIKHFTAIINPPQASILAVGASEERAVVKEARSKSRMSCRRRSPAIIAPSTARSAPN